MPAYPVKYIYDIINRLEIDVDIIYISTDIPIHNKEEIPDHSGLYILVNELGETYIGSSEVILNRLCHHHVLRKEKIISVDVYLIENILNMRLLESSLIYILSPELNYRGRGSLWHSNEEIRINYANTILRNRDLLFDESTHITRFDFTADYVCKKMSNLMETMCRSDFIDIDWNYKVKYHKNNGMENRKINRIEKNYTKYSYADLKPELFKNLYVSDIETAISNFTGC